MPSLLNGYREIDVINSNKPLGSHGVVIVEESSGVNHFQISPKPLNKSAQFFFCGTSFRRMNESLYKINYPGHMTEVAAMPIYGTVISKI